jgi:hypothetical protein
MLIWMCGDGGVHPWPPVIEGFVERGGRLLQVGDAGITELLVCRNRMEALGEGRLLACEALLHLGVELCHLLEDELQVGFHGSKLRFLVARVEDRV